MHILLFILLIVFGHVISETAVIVQRPGNNFQKDRVDVTYSSSERTAIKEDNNYQSSNQLQGYPVNSQSPGSSQFFGRYIRPLNVAPTVQTIYESSNFSPLNHSLSENLEFAKFDLQEHQNLIHPHQSVSSSHYNVKQYSEGPTDTNIRVALSNNPAHSLTVHHPPSQYVQHHDNVGYNMPARSTVFVQRNLNSALPWNHQLEQTPATRINSNYQTRFIQKYNPIPVHQQTVTHQIPLNKLIYAQTIPKQTIYSSSKQSHLVQPFSDPGSQSNLPLILPVSNPTSVQYSPLQTLSYRTNQIISTQQPFSQCPQTQCNSVQYNQHQPVLAYSFARTVPLSQPNHYGNSASTSSSASSSLSSSSSSTASNYFQTSAQRSTTPLSYIGTFSHSSPGQSYATATPLPSLQPIPAVINIPTPKIQPSLGIVQKALRFVQPAIKSTTYEIIRPAVQKQFYDIEEKVFIRPAGNLVVEYDQPISKISKEQIIHHLNQEQIQHNVQDQSHSHYYDGQHQQHLESEHTAQSPVVATLVTSVGPTTPMPAVVAPELPIISTPASIGIISTTTSSSDLNDDDSIIIEARLRQANNNLHQFHTSESNATSEPDMKYFLQNTKPKINPQSKVFSVSHIPINIEHSAAVPFMISVGEPDFNLSPYVKNTKLSDGHDNKFVRGDIPIQYPNPQPLLVGHHENSVLSSSSSSSSSSNSPQVGSFSLSQGNSPKEVTYRVISGPVKIPIPGEKVHTRHIVVNRPIEIVQEVRKDEPFAKVHQVIVNEPINLKSSSNLDMYHHNKPAVAPGSSSSF